MPVRTWIHLIILSSHQCRVRAQKLFLQARAGMAKVLSMHLSLVLISLSSLGAPLYGHGPSTVSKPLCWITRTLKPPSELCISVVPDRSLTTLPNRMRKRNWSRIIIWKTCLLSLEFWFHPFLPFSYYCVNSDISFASHFRCCVRSRGPSGCRYVFTVSSPLDNIRVSGFPADSLCNWWECCWLPLTLSTPFLSLLSPSRLRVIHPQDSKGYSVSMLVSFIRSGWQCMTLCFFRFLLYSNC